MSNLQAVTDILENKIKSNYWPGYNHSYPHRRTFSKLENRIDESVWPNDEGDLNLYLHIPFCEMICTFCVLFKTGTKSDWQDLYENYIEAMGREMRAIAPMVRNRTVKSIYIGGGTPNVLSIKQLEKVLGHVKENFPNISPDIAPCMESQPNNLTEEYVQGVHDLGFKRMSIGVQSFHEQPSKAIGRRPAFDWIEKALTNVSNSKLNLNIDLIYGLPFQKYETFVADIEKALSFNPDNLTMYPLFVRETPIRKLADAMVDQGDKYDWWVKADKFLQSKGFSRESYVRYVKSGAVTYEQQLLEFQGVPTIGFGAGARSYAPGTHYSFPYKIHVAKTKEIVADYMDADFENIHYDGRVLTEEDQKRRTMILNLLSLGIHFENYANYFQTTVLEDFELEVGALKKAQLIETSPDGSRLILTNRGRKYSDICIELFKDPIEESLEKQFVVS